MAKISTGAIRPYETKAPSGAGVQSTFLESGYLHEEKDGEE
jgi:hypothetical protein